MAATKFFLPIDPFAGMLKDDVPIVFSTDDPNTVIEPLFHSGEGYAAFRHSSSDASVVPTKLYDPTIKREGSRIDGKFVGGGYSDMESLRLTQFMKFRIQEIVECHGLWEDPFEPEQFLGFYGLAIVEVGIAACPGVNPCFRIWASVTLNHEQFFFESHLGSMPEMGFEAFFANLSKLIGMFNV